MDLVTVAGETGCGEQVRVGLVVDALLHGADLGERGPVAPGTRAHQVMAGSVERQCSHPRQVVMSVQDREVASQQKVRGDDGPAPLVVAVGPVVQPFQARLHLVGRRGVVRRCAAAPRSRASISNGAMSVSSEPVKPFAAVISARSARC